MTSRFHPQPKRALLAASAFTALALAPVVSTADAAPVTASAPLAARPITQYDEPLVFGHRGASGYRPEHTLASYRLAVEQGADYVEPDLVSTKDGVLVARHENEISGTTDVADRPEFVDRKATKTIDGNQVTGWFTEDFTLAELKTLRAKERLPQVRPSNTAYDGLYEVPTLEEVLDLVDELEAETGRTIGVAPEIKHSTYFDSIGLSMEEPLVATLDDYGLDRRRSTVAIQSFEVSNLKELDGLTDAPLVQLLDAAGGPYDLRAQGVTYARMLTKKGIKNIAKYADWLSPNKNWILPRDPATGATGEPSNVVPLAHQAGLPVVIWTMRAENQFMATNFRVGTDPNAHGDLAAEIAAFLDAGVDAFFTDQPDLGVAARDAWVG